MSEKSLAAIGAIFVVIAVGFLVSVFFTIPVWLLWNWLMPTLFHLPAVTIWQPWGIAFLSRIVLSPSSSSSK